MSVNPAQSTHYISNIDPFLFSDESENSYVLLVEDDPVLSKVMIRALDKRGIELKVVADGQTAVNLLDSDNKPELILLDLVLPIFNGYEILNQIRSTPGWKEIPVIVMSSKSDTEDVEKAFDRGANDFLQKPIQFEDLFRRIDCYSN